MPNKHNINFLQKKSITGLDDAMLMPILSLMVVLVPMLIGNMAFFQLRAIDTTVAVSSPSIESHSKPNNKMNVVSFIYVKDNNVHYDILNEDTGNVILRKDLPFNNDIGIKLKNELLQIKSQYPKFDLLLVSADPSIKYQKLIKVLNECAKPNKITQNTKGNENNNNKKSDVFKIILVPQQGA